MKKQVTITITREDLLLLIAEKGMAVPSSGVTIQSGTEDWADHTEFPITVKWEDNGKPVFDITAKVPYITNLAVGGFINREVPQRIEAIKVLRADLGWGLKQAKDWLDHNYPFPIKPGYRGAY